MKPLLLLLGLSLAANAALFFSRPSPDRLNTADNPAARTASSASLAAPGASSPSSTKTPATPAGPHAAFWEKIRAGDPSVIASLRAAGWPEEAIRAIVEGYVNELFRPRERGLRPDYAKIDYWRQNAFNWSADRMKAYRDLGREKSVMLKKLLGDDYAPTQSIYTAQRYPGLTSAQVEAVQLIDEDYRILRSEISPDYNSPLLPEDREKIAYLEKEKLADLSKILSPAELFEVDLRNSTTASTLRNQLTAFDPTEEEFRQIFALQKAASDAAGITTGAATATQRDELNKAQRGIDAQVKELLSPERYAEYTRAKDFEYRRLYQLTERLQLPKEKALAAYAVKADIEKRLREIKPTPGPDAAKSMNEARAALAKEAEQLLVESLGQRGYDAYKGSGSSWLSRLVPTTGFNPPRPM